MLDLDPDAYEINTDLQPLQSLPTDHANKNPTGPK